jgi:hypothetical protein
MRFFAMTIPVEHFAFAPPNPGIYASLNTTQGYWLYVGITHNLPLRFYRHLKKGWPQTGRPWNEPDLLCYCDCKYSWDWPETRCWLKSFEDKFIHELCPLQNTQGQRIGLPITDVQRLNWYEARQRDLGLTRWADAYCPITTTRSLGR